MGIKLENLIKDGIFDIELGLNNPRTDGYTAGDGVVGKALDGTRWVKTGENDTDWEQIFISTNGEFVANLELADAGGLVLAKNVLGHVNSTLVKGNGRTTGGVKVAMVRDIPSDTPQGMVKLVMTGGIGGNMSMYHTGGSTGLCYSVNYGDPIFIADPDTTYIPTPSTSGEPYIVYIWSATSSSSGVVGYIEDIYAQDKGIISIDVTKLPSLGTLYCNNNLIETLNLSGSTSLVTLSCNNNLIHTLDVSGSPLLESLYCSGNLIESLDVSGLTSLEELSCSGNLIHTLDASGSTSLREMFCSGNLIESLGLSGLTSLLTIDVSGNLLESIDVSGLTSLIVIHANDNLLESVVGLNDTVLANRYSSYNALDLYNNSLGVDAINNIYSDLPDGTGGYANTINVTGNIGAGAGSGTVPSVATAKEWTVVGDVV